MQQWRPRKINHIMLEQTLQLALSFSWPFHWSTIGLWTTFPSNVVHVFAWQATGTTPPDADFVESAKGVGNSLLTKKKWPDVIGIRMRWPVERLTIRCIPRCFLSPYRRLHCRECIPFIILVATVSLPGIPGHTHTHTQPLSIILNL